MPEGDTVFLAATRLRAALGGLVLTKSDLRVPQLATVDLSGHEVLGVVPRGKHLLFRLSDGWTLHTHYKMEGRWHLYRHDEPWRGPAFQVRAVLETEEFVAVGFDLAILELVRTDDEDDIVGHLGPDPLGPDWDAGAVEANMRQRPDDEIGSILLDQSVVAGPGNVYKSEICFLAGIDPRTRVGDVDDLGRVIKLTERLMRANRTTGNQITTGDTRPGRARWVYGRWNKPCYRCGTPIRKADQPGHGGDRVTYWCPRCQPSRELSRAGVRADETEGEG